MKNKGSNIDVFSEILRKNSHEAVPMTMRRVKVTAVDWNNKTMTAQDLIEDLPHEDVRLGFGSIYFKPVIDSLAVIGIIGKKEVDTFLIDAHEIEEAVIKTDDAETTMKVNGYQVNSQGENLKTVMNDFIKNLNDVNLELQKVVVSIGVTPNVPALQNLNTSLNTIKDRLNKILL